MKRKRETIRCHSKQKTQNKIAELSLSMPLIIINVNRLNFPIKG